MLTLYGIKQCDTVKKATKWLDAQGIPYQMIDVKSQPPSPELLEQAWQHFGDKLVNKSSTTWRQLSDADKADSSKEHRLTLLAQNPTLMKRPLIKGGREWTLGFKAEQFAEIYQA